MYKIFQPFNLPARFFLLCCVFLASCSQDPLVDEKIFSGAQSSAELNGGGYNNSSTEGTDPAEAFNPEDYADVSSYDPELYLLGIEARIADDSDVGKTTVNVGDGEIGHVAPATSQWADSDQILVCDSDNNSAIYQYNSVIGKFALAKDNNPLPSGKTYYAYYPASICTKGASASSVSVDFTEDTMMNESDHPETATRAVNLTGCKAPMATCFTDHKSSVTFKNLGHILLVQVYGYEQVRRFSLSVTSGSLGGTGTISFDGTTPSFAATGDPVKYLTMNWEGASGPTLDPDRPTSFYVAIPSSSSAPLEGMKFSITFYQTDNSYSNVYYYPIMTKAVPDGVTLTPSASRLSRVKVIFRHFSGGNGTKASPYLISNESDLRELARLCSCYDGSDATLKNESGWDGKFNSPRSYFSSETYYRQTANITLDSPFETPIGNNPIGITPTKTNYVAPVYFSYDGNYKSISGLRMSSNSYKELGLFGCVTKVSKVAGHEEFGLVKNLNLNTPSVNTSSTDCYTCGALVGFLDNGASVSGCSVTGSGSSGNGLASISGQNCGGLVGYVAEGDVSDSFVYNAEVTATKTGQAGADSDVNVYCGGVIGRIDKGTVSKCGGTDGTKTKTVTVQGTINVGGVVGVLGVAGDKKPVFENGYNVPSVTGSLDCVGGLVGRMAYGSLTNSTLYAGTVSGRDYVGGIVGNVFGADAKVTTFSLGGVDAFIRVQGRDRIGGCAGRINGNDVIIGGTSDSAESEAYVSLKGRQYVGGIVGLSNGACTVQYCDVKKISFERYSETLSELKANLCFGGIIGHFRGNATAGTTVQYCKNSSSLTMGDLEQNFIGGIVGNAYFGTIDHCENICNVQGNNCVGGILGGGDYEGDPNVVNVVDVSNCECSSGVTVKAYGVVGGIVGKQINGTISNCTSAATVASNDTGYSPGGSYSPERGYAGGIAGFFPRTPETGDPTHKPKIKDCLCSGNVSGYNRVGGIVGCMCSGYVEESRYHNIASDSYIKSTVLQSEASAYDYAGDVGGIVGNIQGGTVNKCSAIGRVKGLSYVGGLAGHCDDCTAGSILIMNSIARCDVDAYGYGCAVPDEQDVYDVFAGGLVGRMHHTKPDKDYFMVLANCAVLGSDNSHTIKIQSSCGQESVGSMGFMVGNACGDVSYDISYYPRVVNCYAFNTAGELCYNGGVSCPTSGRFGDVAGFAKYTNLYNCFSRGRRNGSLNNGGVTKKCVHNNLTDQQIAGNAALNLNTDNVLSNGRTVASTWVLHGTLTEGSYSGKTGTDASGFNDMYGVRTELETWAIRNYSTDYIVLPSTIKNKGADWYEF